MSILIICDQVITDDHTRSRCSEMMMMIIDNTDDQKGGTTAGDHLVETAPFRIRQTLPTCAGRRGAPLLYSGDQGAVQNDAGDPDAGGRRFGDDLCGKGQDVSPAAPLVVIFQSLEGAP